MNTIRVLHEAALNLYDEAVIAKAKGDTSSYQTNLEKAFLLEKEAALKIPEEINAKWSRPVLLRSAASLAYLKGDHDTALHLIQLGLSHDPPKLVKHQLNEILKKINKKTAEEKTKKKKLKIEGFLVFANADENLIILRLREGKESFISLTVPQEQMDKIVVSYWKKLVVVEAKTEQKGKVILEKIRSAA